MVTMLDPVRQAPSSLDHVGATLQQVWSPCTRGSSIHRHIQTSHFPATFRRLCQQWIGQGRPRLTMLQYPNGLLYGIGGSVSDSIEGMSSLQEVLMMGTVAGFLREGIVPPLRPFEEVASHVHTYCSIKVELDHLLHHYSESEQLERYSTEWQALLATFDEDRAQCLGNGPHNCLIQLLWGEAFQLSRDALLQWYQNFLCSSPMHAFRPLPVSAGLQSPMVPFGTGMYDGSSPAAHWSGRQLSQSGESFLGSHSDMSSSPGEESPSRLAAMTASMDRSHSLHSTPALASAGLTCHPGSPLTSLNSSSWSSFDGRQTAENSESTLERMQRSDTRAEQNRRKSKRHYERKKLQRALLGELVTKMETSQYQLMSESRSDEVLCRQMQTALAATLPIPPDLMAANDPQLTTNDKKRINKKLQNHLELQRITQLSRAAETMLDDGPRVQFSDQLLLLTDDEVRVVQQDASMEPQAAYLLIWLQCRAHWDELVSAESRLSRREPRPIARLVAALERGRAK